MWSALFTLFIHAGSPANYALVIGNNAPFAAGEDLATLRYADDDAVSFAEFMQTIGAEVTLLSVLDAPTQARFSRWAAVAAPPTRAKLQQAVEALAMKLKRAADAGRPTTLWIFFSGHGQLLAGQEPALALLDAGLTQPMLYDLLSRLPADVVHLFVDACHAEAVVRPRDVPARSTPAPLSAAELGAFATERSLARFANVGAVIATAADQQAHEWDVYERGIFTHQILSALRGAADVNGDRRIEYSELHAFLAAANREISDHRARLAVLVKAPPVNQHTPLVDLGALGHAAFGEIDHATRFWIEDDRGVRLVDANVEASHRVSVALPAKTELFMRTGAGEARFTLAENEHLDLGALALHAPSLKTRGALSTALSRGLFAAPYGPVYYRGFVDSSGELSVDFARRPTLLTESPPAWSPAKRAAVGLWIGAGVGTAAAIGFGLAALKASRDYYAATSDVTAGHASRAYYVTGWSFIALGGISIAAATTGFFLFPWRARVMPAVALDGRGFSFALGGDF